MTTARPAPEHRLVRDGQPAPRLADRRQRRRDQPYRCTCGLKRRGTTSRRDALIVQQMHYAEVVGGKP